MEHGEGEDFMTGVGLFEGERVEEENEIDGDALLREVGRGSGDDL